MTSWHRLFGIMLCDVFTDSPYEVELEKDQSVKQQRLDIVVIRKHSGEFTGRLPYGFDNLADHNLVSFKDKVQYGQGHFHQRSPKTSTLIRDLLGNYRQEGVAMPYIHRAVETDRNPKRKRGRQVHASLTLRVSEGNAKKQTVSAAWGIHWMIFSVNRASGF